MGSFKEGIIRSIPHQAVRATLIIRHSESVQEGSQETRALPPEGVELCHRIAPFYAALIAELTSVFGEAPEFCSSQLIRAVLTCWEIFHPRQLNQSTLLNLSASLKKIDGGKWIEARKAEGWTTAEMIREVVKSKELQAGQPFDQGRVDYTRFVHNGMSTVRVGVGHEPHMSFVAEGLIPDEELGLDEGQGVVFFIDADGDIVSAQKIVPED